MGKKKTIEYIRSVFEGKMYVLKSTEYIDAFHKLDYTCPNGHECSMSWNSFQQGNGCNICAIEKRAADRRHDIEFIRSEFSKLGCILKSTKYINSKTKLDYICTNGHEHSISWNDFSNGHGCPICAYENLSRSQHHGIEYAKEIFSKRNYVLESKVYINNKTKLDYICPEGHRSSITLKDFKRGFGCPICYYLSKFGDGNPAWKGGIKDNPYCQLWTKEFKEIIKERDGYRCQNPYCKCNNGIEGLCIHHIDFNKQNCDPNNLITVCRSCNSMANKDREWHIKWYQTLMAHKHGYAY